MAQLFLVGSFRRTVGVTVVVSRINGHFFPPQPIELLSEFYSLQTWARLPRRYAKASTCRGAISQLGYLI